MHLSLAMGVVEAGLPCCQKYYSRAEGLCSLRKSSSYIQHASAAVIPFARNTLVFASRGHTD
jgi:hypothetical protein